MILFHIANFLICVQLTVALGSTFIYIQLIHAYDVIWKCLRNLCGACGRKRNGTADHGLGTTAGLSPYLARGDNADRNNAKCGAKVATSSDWEGQTCRRVVGMCAYVTTLPHVKQFLWV